MKTFHQESNSAGFRALNAIPENEADMEEIIENMCRAIDPGLFSDSPLAQHRAASPYQVDERQEQTRKRMRTVLKAATEAAIEQTKDTINHPWNLMLAQAGTLED